MVWQANPAGEITFGSSRWGEITGQSDEEKLGSGWLEAVHPHDREPILALWLEALEHRKMYEAYFRVRARDGHWTWQHSRAVPVLAEDGSVVEWMGANVDVTEVTLAREALRASETRLAQAVNVAGLGIC